MTTFIGTSPEMFYTHFFPPCRPSLPFFGRKLDDFILILADSRLNFSRGSCPIGSSISCKRDTAVTPGCPGIHQVGRRITAALCAFCSERSGSDYRCVSETGLALPH